MDDALERLAVGVGDITSTYPDVTGRPIEFDGVFGPMPKPVWLDPFALLR